MAIEIWAGLAWSHSFVLSFQRQNKAMRKSETKTSANLFLGDKEKERKVAKRIAEVRPAHISLLAFLWPRASRIFISARGLVSQRQGPRKRVPEKMAGEQEGNINRQPGFRPIFSRGSFPCHFVCRNGPPVFSYFLWAFSFLFSFSLLKRKCVEKKRRAQRKRDRKNGGPFPLGYFLFNLAVFFQRNKKTKAIRKR